MGRSSPIPDSLLRDIEQAIDDERESDKPAFDYAAWGGPKKMGERQREVYWSDAKYILCHGERGSGKSWVGGGDKLVRHLYENFNALALILVKVKGQATNGGIWEKLQTMVLPEWKTDIGLEYTEEKQDAQKNLYISVRNMHGGWSRVVLVSIPAASMVRTRIRGYEPSYIFGEEITEWESSEYFTLPAQQLGRRPLIKVQQFVCACNPDGPSHWVHKEFFELPIMADGSWDPDYLTVHIPLYQNDHLHRKEEYKTQLLKLTRGDLIEQARMLRGEWIDRPTGDAIFRDIFVPSRHVVGAGKRGILPSRRFPIIVGYDLGISNNSISFMQHVVGKDRAIWTIFDEVVKTNARISYNALVPAIMRKLELWNQAMGHRFPVRHISDSNAFDVYRPHGDGSYDVLEVQRISKKVAARYPTVSPIRMEPAPKFAGSVEVRVRLAMSLLVENNLMVSATCPKHVQMFMNLKKPQGKKGVYDPGAAFRPVRSVHLHAFDSCTYPIIAVDSGSARVDEGQREERGETVIAFGG